MIRVARGTDYEAELAKDPDEPVIVSFRVSRRRRMQLNWIADAKSETRPRGWGASAALGNYVDGYVRRNASLLPPELRD